MSFGRWAVLCSLLAALAAGCTASDPDVAKKEDLIAKTNLRHFVDTDDPRRNSEGTAWEVPVIFGRKECYGLLIFGDDDTVTLRARVPAAGGGEVEQWARNPDANELDSEKFGVCFSK